MKLKRGKIQKLISQLDAICEKTVELENKYSSELALVHPANKKSALNLIHYLALRNEDIRNLQDQLGEIGVSRLGRAESHVMHTILSVKNLLKRIVDEKPKSFGKNILTVKKGNKLLKSNTNALLGKKLKGSSVRIMVTLPLEASTDYKLVHKYLSKGMNCARVNCAHDDSAVWKKIITNINKAKKATGRNCKVCMDLGGPKLRTGAMIPGPKVIHISPKRDLYGLVSSPAEVIFTAGKILPEESYVFIPVNEDWLNSLNEGDEITFQDTRKKGASFIVGKKNKYGVTAYCNESVYILTGTILKNKKTGAADEVGEISAVEEKILLRIGDKLILHKDVRAGEPAKYKEGRLIEHAHISCTLPEVFQYLKTGEPILLDDGKIEGIIKSVNEDEVEVEITYAKQTGTNLRSDKGINLPASKLKISGLTDKDKEDIKFVAEHADIVSLSFANHPKDVIELIDQLKLYDAETGIIIKIETMSAYRNLPGILLAALRNYPVGIMIARGDLAIEAGWKHLAQIQEEILWLSEAAHIPIVWATQVLESLAKKGRPSRAEITDAAMAERAECVMLNKGPYIMEAIEMLDIILKSMQDYQRKKAPMLPAHKYFN